MALKKYDVNVGGVETTLLLSDEDAKAMGLTPPKPPVAKKAAPAPANKARKAPNKKA